MLVQSSIRLYFAFKLSNNLVLCGFRGANLLFFGEFVCVCACEARLNGNRFLLVFFFVPDICVINCGGCEKM